MAPTDHKIEKVEKVVQGIDGKIKKVQVTRLTAPGENFLSLVFRVDFEVEKDGQTKTVNTVAKCLPKGVEKMDFDFHGLAMKNEIRWYSEMVPLIKEFGKEFDINTDYYPEFFGARYSLDPAKTYPDDDTVLLLNNLISEGYKNEDRFIGFDLPATHALLRVVATFHATPLVLKYKKPELFKTIKEFLASCHVDPPKPDSSVSEGPAENDVPFPHMKIIDKMFEIPECQPYLANLKALKSKSQGPVEWNKPGKEPWNTMIHSDYWVNNVMIKPREGQEPLVKVLDFQFCSYSSYAKDVVFFLLSSVRDDVQKQYFDELLRYYYDQLTSILEKINIPELKLSYEDYLEEIKRVALDTETAHALFATTVIFGEKGTGPDLLMGESNMADQVEHMINNISDRQKEKLALMTKLSVERGWL